jgi:hypothetical protein
MGPDGIILSQVHKPAEPAAAAQGSGAQTHTMNPAHAARHHPKCLLARLGKLFSTS